MALKKEIELGTGHVAEYWKITKVDVNRNALSVFCEISLFKNKDSSDAHKAPTEVSKGTDFAVTASQMDGPVDELVAMGYTAFKYDEFFADAEDA